MNREIRWDLVAAARSWYMRWGYQYVETPWYVTGRALRATLPEGKHGFQLCHPELFKGWLVGSAEQGFLQMMLDGDLKPGKYFSATPCFRDDAEDELHSTCFFKVELIEIEDRIQVLDDGNVYRLMSACKKFFEEYSHQEVKVRPTPEHGPSTYDLELNGIEIGSYGLRKHENHKWVYGTGLALPRFNVAAAKCGTPIWDPK
jgi:aspartyl-tRNA synthetase